MTESPEEAAARRFVEAELDVTIEFVDTDGRVDDVFTMPDGRTAAMEITSITDEKTRKAQKAFGKAVNGYQGPSQLTKCWWVMVDDVETRFNDIQRRLEPNLVILERAGLEFDRNALHRFPREDPAVVAAANRLLRAKVVTATLMPRRDCGVDPEHTHQFMLSPMGGWSCSGSDDALSRIEAALASRPDNARKLAEADVEDPHLFVWLDGATEGAISRPFQGGDIHEKYDHFGLPSRPPKLPEPARELWVVHYGTQFGWHWSPECGWAYVQNLMEVDVPII